MAAMTQTKKPRDAKEVSDWLDKRIEPLVKELYREEKESGADAVVLSGSVAGFFLKTSIGIALSNGCPKKVLLMAVDEELKRFPDPGAR